MAKVVSLYPGQLLITVPVNECGPTEELAIAVIGENSFREVARLLEFRHANPIQHSLKLRLY